jgi:thiol:disulfide interchange protein DsbA
MGKSKKQVKKKPSLFKKTAVILGVGLLAFAAAVSTQNKTDGSNLASLTPKEGKEYIVMSSPNEDVKKDNITELFWYGCGHCLAAEPMVEHLKEVSKTKGWEFEQVHFPSTRTTWLFDFNVYAGLQQLGLDQTVGKAYMKAVQSNLDRDDLASFLSDHKIDPVEFNKLTGNEARDKLLEKANKFVSKEVSGTPAFIVSGKYILRDSSDYPGLIEYLIETQP